MTALVVDTATIGRVLSDMFGYVRWQASDSMLGAMKEICLIELMVCTMGRNGAEADLYQGMALRSVEAWSIWIAS